jgi:hypothetical protein
MEVDVTRTARLVIGLAGIVLVATSVRATAEVALPDGPNRAVVMRKCGFCHDMSMVVGTGGRSREGWNGTIEDMVSYGMDITPAERGLVLEYLATYLPALSR